MSRSLKDRTGVNGEIFELLVTISSLWYPGIKNVEELSPKEQKTWIKFRDAAIKGQYSIAELMKILIEAIPKQHAIDIDEQRKLLKAELEDRRQRREEREALLNQRLSELTTNQANGSRERNLFMVLMSVCVIATVAMACLTVEYARPWAYAGTGACLALTGVMGILYRLRALAVAGESPSLAGPPLASEEPAS